MSIKKTIIALLLLIAAGGLSFAVKELIDVNNPEYAVAKLTVTADSEEVPVIISAFDWSFSFGASASREAPDVSEINPAPALLLGGESLELSFSQPLLALEVLRSESYSYSFFDINGDLTVPYEKGAYLYRVNAAFERGEAQYYFYIVVE
ncbi:MAG: hypothetical protein Q4B42_04885 [Oscillospiraceae bacterium]|nr:hypothetical protein [Oscillospiraceae bacterium]